MKNNEIVAALRTTESRSKRELLDAAADLIERLTARCARYAEEIAVAQDQQRWIPVTERLPEVSNDLIEAQEKQIDALRNELCLKCGNYTLAHEGACNGCRWRR